MNGSESTVDRRNFIKAMAATGAAAAVGKGALAANAPTDLPVPAGAEFAGMGGAFSAMVTPFTPDNRVNEEMIERIVEFGIASGLKGFYLTGSTGEGMLMSPAERELVIRRAVKTARGRVKMIAHIGAVGTDEALVNARNAAKAGVDWLSAVGPVFFGKNFNGTYDYYDRDESHFNLGYDKWVAINSGLELPHDTWPNSDIELIDVTTGDYMTADKPFSVYYLTISGHAPHTFVGSSMASKNKDLVADMPYSDEVKAYMAAEIELDRAMELLLKRLEEAGKLDDTLIVLAADHYPYGLNEDEYNELAGKEIDTSFEKYKNSFICYEFRICTTRNLLLYLS